VSNDYGLRPYASNAESYLDFISEVTNQYITSIGGVIEADFIRPYLYDDYTNMEYIQDTVVQYLGGTPQTLDDLSPAVTPYIPTEGEIISAIKNWKCVRCDSDGSFYIGCVYGGRVYISSDSGVTWTDALVAGNANKNFNSVACNTDGTKLYASVDFGRIYKSTDSGVTWSEIQPKGSVDGYWASIDCDSTGDHIIVAGGDYVDGYGNIYISTNTGSSWTERKPPIIAALWSSVSSSADGAELWCAYQAIPT
jgi:hypothetical protein